MTAIVLVSIVVRLGIGEALVRYHYVDEDRERRDALARRAVGFLLIATTVVAIPLALAAGPLSELVLGFRDVGVFRVAVLGPVGLHQPRAGLRAAARRRARAGVRADDAVERAADDRVDGLPRRRPRQGRARPAARQLRRDDGRAAGAVVHDAPPSAAAPRRRRSPETALAARAAQIRLPDRPCRRLRLRAQPRRPLLPVPQVRRRDRRRLLARGQAGRRRRLRRARLPVLVAAAGVLDQGRRRGGEVLRLRRDLLPAADRLGGRRAAAARPLDDETARRARSSTRRTSRSRGWRSAGRSTACS